MGSSWGVHGEFMGSFIDNNGEVREKRNLTPFIFFSNFDECSNYSSVPDPISSTLEFLLNDQLRRGAKGGQDDS